MAEQNTDLAVFKCKYYWQYTLLAAALAYLFLWDPVHRWWVFETRTVEITSVQSLCAAFEETRSIPLEVGDCDDLKEKMNGKKGVEIKPRTFATFSYQSPADNSTQSVSIVRDLDDAGKPIAVGSRLTVLLSRNEPKAFRLP
jgi:hypothetical protein